MSQQPGAQTERADVIKTVDLTKVYPGDVTAVDGLNLIVGEGEIFGLLGPNGAGKTTTASMLTTRVIPTSGEAYVGGIDVVAHPAVAKQLIGVVPQTNTLDRALTVWENLYFHGRFFGMGAARSRAVADDLLVKFHLKERAKAPVMALSGGLAQRLMVARALVHNPAILFLDEPTAGLDPQSRIGLWEIVSGLHEAGQTVVLTTHNMEEADQLCDRIGIMDHGKILALGTPSELKASVGADTMVTVSAEGDLDELARRLHANVDGADSATTLDGSVQLAVRGADRVLLRVIGAADAAGYTVRDVQVAPPSLENVFINLTGKEFRD
ncbi:MAG TPA: ATP-binding cassette domain-containing protein [Gaiellales bacterium]